MPNLTGQKANQSRSRYFQRPIRYYAPQIYFQYADRAVPGTSTRRRRIQPAIRRPRVARSRFLHPRAESRPSFGRKKLSVSFRLQLRQKAASPLRPEPTVRRAVIGRRPSAPSSVVLASGSARRKRSFTADDRMTAQGQTRKGGAQLSCHRPHHLFVRLDAPIWVRWPAPNPYLSLRFAKQTRSAKGKF